MPTPDFVAVVEFPNGINVDILIRNYYLQALENIHLREG